MGKIDLSDLVRVMLPRANRVEVRLFLMGMIRSGRIVVISMHVQSHSLDEHQGDSQVGYPEDFLECIRLRSMHDDEEYQLLWIIGNGL